MEKANYWPPPTPWFSMYFCEITSEIFENFDPPTPLTFVEYFEILGDPLGGCHNASAKILGDPP